jgi:hypothetical protein
MDLPLTPVTFDITLEGSLGILANIQSNYANLTTLTTSLYSTNAIELRPHKGVNGCDVEGEKQGVGNTSKSYP